MVPLAGQIATRRSAWSASGPREASTSATLASARGRVVCSVALPEKRKVGGSTPPLTTSLAAELPGQTVLESSWRRCRRVTFRTRSWPLFAAWCCTWAARRWPKKSRQVHGSPSGGTVKKISSAAYLALRDALPAIVWNKRPFETFVRTALREHGELLAGLNFSDTKREVADVLVERLSADEHKYRDVTLLLMREISSLNRFPNVEQIKDPEDRKLRLAEAEAAVGLLRYVIRDYEADLAEAEKQTASIQARVAQAAALRRFKDDLDSLKAKFIGLQTEADVHRRGYALESLLAEMFLLYDLEPRLAYTIPLEQIDGSFTFDTDDYVVEARWRSTPADRGDADIFASKVRRKGKNAVGLFLSINGFTEPFREAYKESTPFVAMDGADLYAVLDNRVRFDDLLEPRSDTQMKRALATCLQVKS